MLRSQTAVSAAPAGPHSRDDSVEFAGDARTRKRGVYHQCNALAVEAVYPRQVADAPAANRRGTDEVETPPLVGTLRQRDECPRFHGSPPAAPAPHSQVLLTVQSQRHSKIHDDASYPSEHDPQPPVADATTLGRDLPQTRPQVAINRAPMRVAHRSSIHAEDGTAGRSPMRNICMLDSPSLTLSLTKFAAASSSRALSTIPSASNRFSRTRRPTPSA